MAIVNEWQQVESFPTPISSDLLFYEIKDSNIPRNQNWNYGDPHPNKTRYPDHELIFVTPVEKGKNPSADQQWWYAARRENQDLYNFSFVKADIGGTKFDSVVRSYVTLRSEFDPDEYTMGDAMPNFPAGMFTGSYVLAERAQKRIGEQELDSLYIAEVFTYVRKVTLGELGYDERTGRSTSSTVTLYHSSEVVSGGSSADTLFADTDNAYWGLQTDGTFRTIEQISDNWYAVTERSVLPESPVNATANPAKARIVNRVTPLGTDVIFTEIGAMPASVPAYGSAHYDAGTWPNHRLALIEAADNSGLLHKFTYVADRASQDDYNFELVGGEQVIRTYVILRSLYFARPVGHVSAVAGEFLYPPAGAATPDVRYADYCFADDTQRRLDPEFDSLYVVIQRRFIRPTTVAYEYDEKFKRSIRTTKEVIPKTTAAPALGALGTSVEIQDGNSYYSVRITKELILVSPEVYPYSLPNIPATQDYRFPSKLESVSLVAAWAWASSTGHRDSYSEDYYFKFKITDPRPGPYSATILRWVTDNPEAVRTANPVTIVPQPIRESVAVAAAWFYASSISGNATSAVAKEWSVPPTIHNEITISLGGTYATSKAQDRSILEPIAATPNVAAYLALTEVTIDYQVQEMGLGLYLVSVVKINIAGLYS